MTLQSSTLFHIMPFPKIIGFVKKNFTKNYFSPIFFAILSFCLAKCEKNTSLILTKLAPNKAHKKSKQQIPLNFFENFCYFKSFYQFFIFLLKNVVFGV